MAAADHQALEQLPVEGQLPSLAGAVDWLNSPSTLTAESLRGHIVLIDFWAYSCINCLRTLPYVEAWARKYRDQGLIVIAVHAPEFAFERNVDNVRAAVRRLVIDCPVAIDNNYAIWRGFNNDCWPAHYFIDANGNVRHHHFGEGNYDESERVIQELLREAGHQDVASGTVSVSGNGSRPPPTRQMSGPRGPASKPIAPRVFRIARWCKAGPSSRLYGAHGVRPQSVGAHWRLACRRAGCCTRAAGRRDHIPFLCTGSAFSSRTWHRRQAGKIPGPDRWPFTRRQSRRGYRRRRQRRHHRPAVVPAGASRRRGRRPHLPDPLSRRWCDRLFVYLWLNPL